MAKVYTNKTRSIMVFTTLSTNPLEWEMDLSGEFVPHFVSSPSPTTRVELPDLSGNSVPFVSFKAQDKEVHCCVEYIRQAKSLMTGEVQAFILPENVLMLTDGNTKACISGVTGWERV